MTTPEDFLAVQRTHTENGRDAALAEIRKRWPMIAENVIERTLGLILAAPVEPPAQYDPRVPRRDAPGLTRRSNNRT